MPWDPLDMPLNPWDPLDAPLETQTKPYYQVGHLDTVYPWSCFKACQTVHLSSRALLDQLGLVD